MAVAGGQGPIPVVQLTPQALGGMESFDPNGPISLDQWYERFKIFCDINQVLPDPQNANGDHLAQPDRRRLLFLHAIGDRAYGALLSSCLPNNPSSFAIPELLELLKEQLQPQGLVAANRLTFKSRLQRSNESVCEYISALQALAQYCDFGVAYEMSLISQLIFGIRHNDTRSKFMAPGLSWADAKVIASNDDVQRTQMKTIVEAHLQAQSRAVNMVKSNQATSNKPNSQKQPQARHPQVPNPTPRQGGGNDKQYGPCYRCGKPHNCKTCPAAKFKCGKCNKIGHIAKVCQSKSSSSDNKKPPAGVKQVVASNPPPHQGNPTEEELVDNLLSFGVFDYFD